MIGVFVNVAAVILGSIIGLLCKKGIKRKVTDAVVLGMGLCVMYVGITGVMKGQNAIVAVLSMALGGALGTMINIDKQINKIGDKLSAKVKTSDQSVSITEGFVTASLLFCVGAMSIDRKSVV